LVETPHTHGQARTGDIDNIKNTQSLINTRSFDQSIENPQNLLNPNSTISKSIHKITRFIYLGDFPKKSIRNRRKNRQKIDREIGSRRSGYGLQRVLSFGFGLAGCSGLSRGLAGNHVLRRSLGSSALIHRKSGSDLPGFTLSPISPLSLLLCLSSPSTLRSPSLTHSFLSLSLSLSQFLCLSQCPVCSGENRNEGRRKKKKVERRKIRKNEEESTVFIKERLDISKLNN
jgi:hypothetical protein